MMSLVQYGKLPEAVAASLTLDELVGSSPMALERAVIMKDLKVCPPTFCLPSISDVILQRGVTALKANVEGQLLECLAQAVVAQPLSFTIQNQVQGRSVSLL